MKPYQKRDSDRSNRENRLKKSNPKKEGDQIKGEILKKEPYKKKVVSRSSGEERGEKPFNKRGSGKSFERDQDKKPFAEGRKRGSFSNSENKKPYIKKPSDRPNKDYKSGIPERADKRSVEPEEELIRLNRFISNAGICGRREADKLIVAGDIKVNGKKITQLGTKVKRSDEVTYLGKSIRSEKPVYVLLNKPKGFITTMNDPKKRRTVMELVSAAGKERIYPVGRLDMDTTGLLLLTNDGELTKKLTHPSHEVHKLYHVTVQRDISDEDIAKISEGLTLEDGFIKADKISRITNGGKNEIGIELHSGKNRIVRRIMEHLDYSVIKLDRVVFANLNKKDLPRGKWRKLAPKELVLLKRIGTKKNESET